MSLADKLRSIATSRPEDAEALADAASVLDFACGNMRAYSLHMDGTACYLMSSAWPMSSVRARSAEEALLKCVEMTREAKEEEARHGG